MKISSTELESLLARNIRTALDDYGARTYKQTVLEDVSDKFIGRLARDAVSAKAELREMLGKSPAWDENLQAVVINGTRTHDPDDWKIFRLGRQILQPYLENLCDDEFDDVLDAVRWFAFRENKELIERGLAAINRMAPNVYHKGRKRSRIFKSICDALGVTDETKGSEFQKLYAQFADELSTKKINFKLFLSINPAHFLTMSNPKDDERGDMLTSCHSLNNTDYEYNNGCTGYARDKVTMIAFTVNDPDDSELLNNRKTSRQLFMYQPGNGVLLQSRMYDTNGGADTPHKYSPLYRDLVQREISELEGVPNLWKTYSYTDSYDKIGKTVIEAYGFGGYCDWKYTDFDAKISIRADHKDDFVPILIGAAGLCVKCGDVNSEGMYCDTCDNDGKCDHCGCRCHEDDLYYVHDENGESLYVCDDCRCSYYGYCERCDEYYHENCMSEINGEYVCDGCRDEYFAECDDCGEWVCREDMCCVFDRDGCEIHICQNCYESGNYEYCEDCFNTVHVDYSHVVTNEDGTEFTVCDDCYRNRYEAQA